MGHRASPKPYFDLQGLRVLRDERLALLPGQETAPVHPSIRVFPQWVRFIGNEVGRAHKILAGWARVTAWPGRFPVAQFSTRRWRVTD